MHHGPRRALVRRGLRPAAATGRRRGALSLVEFLFCGGRLPCRRLPQRGNLVGLGTDVAGGYHPSLLHSARMAVIASQALQQQQQIQQQPPQKQQPAIKTAKAETEVLAYRHAFYMATLGGAEALGLQSRIGSLAVGMESDAALLSAQVGMSSPVPILDSDSLADVFQKLCVLDDDRNVK